MAAFGEVQRYRLGLVIKKSAEECLNENAAKKLFGLIAAFEKGLCGFEM